MAKMSEELKKSYMNMRLAEGATESMVIAEIRAEEKREHKQRCEDAPCCGCCA